MAIVYAGKTFSAVLNDKVNVYYTDPECNAKLGAGEKFFVEVRTSGVLGTAPTIAVKLESSNDNVNWVNRSTITLAPSSSISNGATLTGAEVGGTTVGGRFARFTMQLADAGSPSAYVELWVTARNAL